MRNQILLCTIPTPIVVHILLNGLTPILKVANHNFCNYTIIKIIRTHKTLTTKSAIVNT